MINVFYDYPIWDYGTSIGTSMNEWWDGRHGRKWSWPEVLSQNLSRGSEENHKIPVRLSDVPTNIWTKHLPCTEGQL